MKKLLLLTTAAAMVMAIAEPGIAASRHRHMKAERPAATYLDPAGRARTYGEPTDAYASGSWEPHVFSSPAYQAQPQEAFPGPSYGGTNGW